MARKRGNRGNSGKAVNERGTDGSPLAEDREQVKQDGPADCESQGELWAKKEEGVKESNRKKR
jgi:hypothetical protein